MNWVPSKERNELRRKIMEKKVMDYISKAKIGERNEFISPQHRFSTFS